MNLTKQVKVDNWGIFFLQRLKQFFNRTSYCDLTLQFHDNAQLKVHRLVLNACTEYFEILEQTCEMHDDCLIMPDDMQADVVVPIVNFMYTGQLEYNYNLFERLYSTAQIMKMTVLTKLLITQRSSSPVTAEVIKPIMKPPRTLNNDYLDEPLEFPPRLKLHSQRPIIKNEYKGRAEVRNQTYKSYKLPPPQDPAKPTRYELPEELDSDETFEPSFSNISYESRSLMHKSNMKQEDYETSNIRKFSDVQRSAVSKRPSTSATESKSKRMFVEANHDNSDLFDSIISPDFDESMQTENKDESSILYSLSDSDSKILKFKNDEGGAPSVNHAKVISEVLKQYPHILKSNKNIKVRIVKPKNALISAPKPSIIEKPKYEQKINREDVEGPEWTYVPKDIHNDAIGNLVSLGLHNKNGPWLCLICGTPTKALNFSSYYAYRRHLVEVHKEKASSMICEYCGHKSGRRNHLLHHMYARHGVPPPPNYHFPKCNRCPYIALTEGNLAKHKLIHKDSYVCSVCTGTFSSRQNLLHHMHMTGHNKVDKKQPSQCAYCNKTFHRAANLYAHYKILHKAMAENDGLLEPSDDENLYDDDPINTSIYDQNQEEVHIKQEADGKYQIISKVSPQRPQKPTILNNTLGKSAQNVHKAQLIAHDSLQDSHSTESGSESENLPHIPSESLNMEQIVVLNDNEIIINPEHFTAKSALFSQESNDEIIVPNLLDSYKTTNLPKPQSYGSKFKRLNAATPVIKEQVIKHVSTNQGQQIQIVVSENQQYKTIMTSQPLVHNVNQGTTMATVTRGISQMQNLNLDRTQAQNIVVLQDGFSMPQQTLRSDDSNIVVVYSHPIDAANKEYVQIGPHYSQVQISSSHDIPMDESQLESREIQTQENILLEDQLVHETVETWHEEHEHEEEMQDEVEESEDMIRENVSSEMVPVSSSIIPSHQLTKNIIADSHAYSLHHNLETTVELQDGQNIAVTMDSLPNNDQKSVLGKQDSAPATLYYVESQPIEGEIAEEQMTDDDKNNGSNEDKTKHLTWVADEGSDPVVNENDSKKSIGMKIEETIENIEVEIQKYNQDSKNVIIESGSSDMVIENESPAINTEPTAHDEKIVDSEKNSTENVIVQLLDAGSQETSNDTTVPDEKHLLHENVVVTQSAELAIQVNNGSATLQIMDHSATVTSQENTSSSTKIISDLVQDEKVYEEAPDTKDNSKELCKTEKAMEESKDDETIEDEDDSQEESSVLEDDSIEDQTSEPHGDIKVVKVSDTKVNGKSEDKISTLLDDWEDNESQNEASKGDDVDMNDNDDTKQEEEKAKTITTLVSDWDD